MGNDRTYATSQNLLLPFSFTYNFINFSIPLVSELQPSVRVHHFVGNIVCLFYFDCILRGYDVKTTTEATGMRPDVLHESICPQDRNECSSMSAFTQHIGSSVSCQQFVQGHLVGTASVLCMTSDNAEASSVVTNNKKTSVLPRKLVNAFS